MMNLFQITNRKLIILMHTFPPFLPPILLNAHPLIMFLKFLTQLFSTQKQGFLPLLKIIRDLDISKAHGFDDILIRMVKLCDDSPVKPLSIIFQKCIHSGVFPDSWKKSNIVPIHRKNDKQLINNCRSFTLLPICSKIFEGIIFNSIFQFVEENKCLM